MRRATRLSKSSAVCEPVECRQLLSTSVLTWHGNSARTGLDNTETVLTQNTVKTRFGLQHTLHVDGAVYAQPLYVPNVNVNGTRHNLVIIATQHDSIWAFDADTGKYAWTRSFIDPKHGVTPVPAADTQTEDISPEVGITGTPVIDGATGTMYFVTKVKIVSGSKTRYEQRLRAVDVRNGRETIPYGVAITGEVPGAGDGAVDTDTGLKLFFDPLKENQRSALTLSGGKVFITYASHGDIDPYNGWVFAYDAKTLKQSAEFVTAPDGIEAPIWMSGAGFAVDNSGFLYATTGNGTFDIPAGGDDYGDTFLKLQYSSAKGITVNNYFTPHNAAQLLRDDLDLGSGGVTLLPDQPGTHKHEAVFGGKEGILYLVDRDNPGKFSTSGDAVIQKINVDSLIYSTPAYFNGSIYFSTVDGKLMQYKLSNGKLSTRPASVSSESYGFPGTTATVSANGTGNGIVWAIERRLPPGGDPEPGDAPAAAILHAYDAGNLSHELFSSSATGSGANFAGMAVKFTVPTVADGHVFVGGNKTVSVFGSTTAIA